MNIQMPMFIPESLLNIEKDHVEGFAPEVVFLPVITGIAKYSSWKFLYILNIRNVSALASCSVSCIWYRIYG